MHIPDGYLSPGTCGLFYAVMAPVWYWASKRAERTLSLRQLPLLALAAAFAFVIMMFNIPVPGGSSGHMVGAVVAAVALGPWAAVVAMSLTLTLQALFFGDGGITTLAANCFNMALLMVMSGHLVYSAVAFGEPGPARRFVAAAAAAYIAVNLAALSAAVELGVQPLLAHSPDGRPLYAPYPLEIAVPAMALPHLVFFGPVEAIGTALVLSWAYKADRGLFHKGGKFLLRPLWMAMALLAVLTPLGLLATGTPWGEWSAAELRQMLGYVPEGIERYGNWWSGLMPDYSLPGADGPYAAFAYVLAALAGSAAIVAVVYLWSRPWRR